MNDKNNQPGGNLHDDALERPLALARNLLEGVYALAQQLSELGAIELPPMVRPAADAGHVQTAATLYLASELEAARLVPTVELLAGIFASGALRLDGEVAEQIYRFWQQRNNRFSQQERTAIFARLFGYSSESRLAVSGSRNREFEEYLKALAEAIIAAQPNPVFGSRRVSNAALAVSASRLVNNLVTRSGGITAFAARDILKTIEQALAILKLRPVQAAMGAIGVWTAVHAVARRYLNEEVNVSAHVRRGRSGMLVLTWVAEIVPQLDSVTAGDRLLPQYNITSAAIAWLQASQELQERIPTRQSPLSLPFPRSAALVKEQS